MNKKLPLGLIAIVSTVLCASAGAASLAHDSHFASPQALAQVHAGESKDDVIRQLGAPEYTPKWGDGTYSLAYETLDSENTPHAQAYVDIDTASGKVVNVSVQNQD